MTRKRIVRQNNSRGNRPQQKISDIFEINIYTFAKHSIIIIKNTVIQQNNKTKLLLNHTKEITELNLLL